MSAGLFPEQSGATFSPCRYYRYTLWRTWDTSKPACLFLMLNPSTADETDNDPTVERCQRRAVAMGYGGLVVCNIFAYRSTDPGVLYTAPTRSARRTTPPSWRRPKRQGWWFVAGARTARSWVAGPPCCRCCERQA